MLSVKAGLKWAFYGLYLFPVCALIHGHWNQGQVHAAESGRFKFSGEYGLWVEVRDTQVDVHWLTAKQDSGFLEVLYRGRVLLEFSTPESQAHRATFDSRNLDPLTIRYGSATTASDRHETVLYLQEEDPDYVFDKVDSIYVLGDLHGEFENLKELLIKANLVDFELNWRGGRRHLVALGDIFDRGHDVTKTLWFLYKLERQARIAGGRVHVVLGNHEIMTFCNDLRYLSGKENLIGQLHGTTYSNLFNVRHSLLGRWLASKPGLIKINEILFAHGGVDPVYRDWTLQAFNDSLRAFMQEDMFQDLLQDSVQLATRADSIRYYRRLIFFFDENSVFWNRAYVMSDTLKNELKDILKRFKSRVHVVAHTALPTIRQFYDGKVIAVDLRRPATEILLLVGRKTKKMKRFKISLQGVVIPLTS
ncbi:metallophosphoesterase [bacterium]|nr:metallophosphoesterase [bacterium]